jgi:hypothetical protein
LDDAATITKKKREVNALGLKHFLLQEEVNAFEARIKSNKQICPNQTADD